MRQKRPLILSILCFLALGLLPASSSAQGDTTYSAGLMLGLGGATDAEPDTGFDNFGFQGFFSMETAPRARFTVRAGQLNLDAGDAFFESDLTYLTLSGGYEFPATLYKSWLFVGLGLYDASGDAIEDDSGLGLTVGTMGEFRLRDRFGVVVEISGHFADLSNTGTVPEVKSTRFFVMGLVGVAYHF